MCGINGIYSYQPAASVPSDAELLATRDHMVSRGPDGAGAWRSKDDRAALGHRRLAIIDLSERGAQPMLSADKRLAVTFNGEIYNYPELRLRLQSEGVVFRSGADTEVLLHLYARKGAAMVEDLRGMYAFAIWDEDKQGLFLARDPYGIKPLYTANDGWTFRFASQVKALLAGGKVSRDPEPAGLVGFHIFGSVPEPFTLYREIRALPAGHTQWVDAGGPRLPKPFTSIASVLADGAAIKGDPRAIVREAVGDSVRAHMLADVEVGIFLSAGIDSGALLGLMRDTGRTDVPAITLAFDEFAGTVEDEAPEAARIAELYGARHIVSRISIAEMEESLPQVLEAMDQPSIDGINTWFVARAARQAGLKVAISGVGGDEIFAGYPSFTDMPRWRRRVGPLAAIPGLGRLVRSTLQLAAPGFARAQPKALSMVEYANSRAGTYLLRRGLYMPHELPRLMDRELAVEGLRRLRLLPRIAAMLKPDPGSEIARICALESSLYLRNQLLRDVDWAGMDHGVEIRTPLVDIELLRRLAPVIATLKPGTGKALLAAAPATPLPSSIADRAKTGFRVPLQSWLSAVTPAKADPLAPNGIASRDWSRLVMSHFSGTPALAGAA